MRPVNGNTVVAPLPVNGNLADVAVTVIYLPRCNDNVASLGRALDVVGPRRLFDLELEVAVLTQKRSFSTRLELCPTCLEHLALRDIRLLSVQTCLHKMVQRLNEVAVPILDNLGHENLEPVQLWVR